MRDPTFSTDAEIYANNRLDEWDTKECLMQAYQRKLFDNPKLWDLLINLLKDDLAGEYGETDE